jgi:hypothetical protein
VKVDEDMFEDGTLYHPFWSYKFGAAGARLAATMPQNEHGYARKAIVGSAELADVVEYSDSGWYVSGSYGFILQDARPLGPIANYSGQRMLFDVPLSIIKSEVA